MGSRLRNDPNTNTKKRHSQLTLHFVPRRFWAIIFKSNWSTSHVSMHILPERIATSLHGGHQRRLSSSHCSCVSDNDWLGCGGMELESSSHAIVWICSGCQDIYISLYVFCVHDSVAHRSDVPRNEYGLMYKISGKPHCRPDLCDGDDDDDNANVSRQRSLVFIEFRISLCCRRIQIVHVVLSALSSATTATTHLSGRRRAYSSRDLYIKHSYLSAMAWRASHERHTKNAPEPARVRQVVAEFYLFNYFMYTERVRVCRVVVC